jgi:hypothetical protein
MVVAIVAIISGIAVGVTPSIIGLAKGQSAAAQLNAFLKRTRELAISRRRNIEVVFTAPNQVQTLQRAVPNPPAVTPAPTPLETIYLEGAMEFRTFAGVPDTPDAFATPVVSAMSVGNQLPVMFTSEGAFVDANGDPINATLFLGKPQQINTANALTILGATAMVRSWRWNGARWIQ